MALFSSCKMYDNLPEGDDKPALYLTKEMGKLLRGRSLTFL